MVLYNIFPTAVARFELGRDFSAEELAFVTNQKTYKNHSNTTSENRYVLQHDTMAKLREFIENSVAEYFKSIHAPKHDVSLRITQSWLNYTKPGEFHHKHEHPNSFISGVLYLKAARERDKINFYRGGYELIQLPSDNWNLFNSGSWWFEVGTGDLMIFPSHLTHMVETVQEEDRISLSFNTFPIGYVGEEETLTALNL